MNLTDLVYEFTRNFPRQEEFGLKSQIRRSAVSIPSNIAEGSQRRSDKEFAGFILIAKGSLAELETQIIIAKNAEYFSEDQTKELITLIDELSRMIYAFFKKLSAKLQAVS